MTSHLVPRPGALEQSKQQRDYILIDCSSSMMDKWYESLAAVDAYVAGLRTEAVPSLITLHMFYSQNPDYVHRDDMLPADWQPLVEGAPEPSGLTPLYDAINLMGLRLRQMNPERASIVIVTDGGDSGGGTSVTQARAIIDWMKAKGWQVTFIGADFSNSTLARALGADKNTAIGVQKHLLADSTAALARKRRSYGLNGTPMHWSESEQQQFGGYLANPGSNGK